MDATRRSFRALQASRELRKAVKTLLFCIRKGSSSAFLLEIRDLSREPFLNHLPALLSFFR